MNLNEFITKYIGKKVDFDGAYGAQCVDLFRQYCKDVLKIPHTGSVDGAKDLMLQYDNLPLEKKYFNAIKTRNVRYGDIAVYGATKTNKYGHVAIVVSAIDKYRTLVFEQNGYTQDGAKLVERSVDNIIGILRFKEDSAK